MAPNFLRYATLLSGCLAASQGLAGPRLVPQIPIQDAAAPLPAVDAPKNIVFILTDDQDLQLDSLEYMPLLQKHIGKKGTFYKNHFTTTAICCPSRVALWTGKQPHNTNVTDVSPPYGGFPKFIERGFNDAYLPLWLQNAGYNTFYTGKMFNSHTVNNYDSPHLKGFTGSDFLLDPFTYSYLNSTYQRNHDPPTSYEGHHTADVIAEKALGFLDDAINSDKPFFLTVAPVSPHSNIDINRNAVPRMQEPIPAERHKHLFDGVKLPRTPHFNADAPSAVNWISRLPQRNASTIEYFDHYYRQRLRALQSVDELVESIVNRLDDAGLLDDTYIVYSSDNGFHIGQHRLPPGKECAFEEDIRIPLYIRGPGIPEGHVEDAVTTHIDLAPTFFQIAGLELRDDFDGTPIPLYNSKSTYPQIRHEHVGVEYWGIAIAEGESDGFDNGVFVIRNNTYKAIRIIGEGYNLLYTVWCTNEHELYNLEDDPYQLSNLYPKPDANPSRKAQNLLGRDIYTVIQRLDSLLLVLKSCKGSTCIEPWKELHLDEADNVQDLKDALHPKYDELYGSQPRVEFSRCEEGYLIDAEGPQFESQKKGKYGAGLRWSEWT